MLLAALLAEFAGRTILQQEEHSKGFIGVEVELRGLVGGVDSHQIWFHSWLPPLPDALSQIAIKYSGEELRVRFLKMVQGDVLRLAARLERTTFKGINNYEFQVLRVLEHQTYQEWKSAQEAEAKAGCFVATAAFGYDDANVQVLRAYRDRVMSATVAGATLVRLYYSVSPTIASFIHRTARRRAAVRAMLAPIVRHARRRLARMGDA